MLATSLFSFSATDLARPGAQAAERLSATPNIWVAHDFLSSTTLEHLLSKVPKSESAYEPCIGQVDQFASKRCTMLPVSGDDVAEAVVAKIGNAWQVDTTRLSEGLPIIRYLPGAPPVGKHGDMNAHGVVPNATLVVYLTDAEVEGSGHTVFPDADVSVAPRKGSVLAFQNVDDAGAPHPKAQHLVGSVAKVAQRDRLVMQIPLMHPHGEAAYAYPQHVSGMKKPGQHESMHGSQAAKDAYAAAIAAGFGVIIAYMAAKKGEFKPDEVAAYATAAKESAFKKDGKTRWWSDAEVDTDATPKDE
jgi:hypothetical protein